MGKKVIFVSYGDSTNASSWSNVPYLFSQSLEKKGFELVRMDISPDPLHHFLWDRFVAKVLSTCYTDHVYSYMRSWVFRILIFRKIKKAVKENDDAYFCIFLNFEFYNKFSKIPTLLFGDWTYDIVIFDHLKRKPYFFEKWFIKYQAKAIKKAELVVSLFKDCSEKISSRYNKDVRHLGINVVNDLNLQAISHEEILEKKKFSNEILFIGSRKYIEGAKKLVEAFKVMQITNPELQLNLIGIQKEDLLDHELPNVHFFGYLRKDNPTENKLYYSLLINAKVLVNPSENWAAYSSSIEAMKYCTPVIIKPYKAFTEDFGFENDFGYYLVNTSVNCIIESIQSVFLAENYVQLCKNASYKVKDFTWENYVEKLIAMMSEIKQLK